MRLSSTIALAIGLCVITHTQASAQSCQSSGMNTGIANFSPGYSQPSSYDFQPVNVFSSSMAYDSGSYYTPQYQSASSNWTSSYSQPVSTYPQQYNQYSPMATYAPQMQSGFSSYAAPVNYGSSYSGSSTYAAPVSYSPPPATGGGCANGNCSQQSSVGSGWSFGY